MSRSEKEAPPPCYDQIVEIDNPTAPTLHQTFPGSIFGTSTVVTLELAFGSYPVEYSSCLHDPQICDFSLVIRDFLGCVQAKANVSGPNVTLQNVIGTEILQMQLVSEPTNPPNAVQKFLSKIYKKKENTSRTYEVLKNNIPFGLFKYAEAEPAERSLSIHHGRSEIVVKSLALGDFVIFRDCSSSTPLCNIQVADARISYNVHQLTFDTKIIFHPEAGITTEEQMLCTAAAIAIKVTLMQLSVNEENDSKQFARFWGSIFVVVMIAAINFLSWLI